jgi:hypothetical protein
MLAAGERIEDRHRDRGQHDPVRIDDRQHTDRAEREVAEAEFAHSPS